MTRSYFWDYVDGWGELIELCQDEGCNICDDIIDDGQLDECVDADIEQADYSWRQLSNYLSEIPRGYNYYRCDGSFDYVGLDDSDFEDYKSRVGDWMDDGYWELEEDDEDEDNFDPNEVLEPEESPVEDEDFSVSELMCMCSAKLATIRQVADRQKMKSDRDVPSTLLF